MHLMLAFVLFISSCSSPERKAFEVRQDSSIRSSKTLIVYLSRTENTKAIAEIIHQNVGGKLVALELEKPYPENYQAIVAQVVKENETGYLPPLKTPVSNNSYSGSYRDRLRLVFTRSA